ncbi:hypothetical protein [Streptomyces sp. NPDC101237]|uniref:hypothetical protein n=1 Tax=Streptomyces sp. NPDC101237 TaxID=3366139 RepID=UPI0038210171
MDLKTLGHGADAAARAFGAARATLVGVVPGATRRSGPQGTLLALTRTRIPALNVVMSMAKDPSGEEVADFAAVAAKEAAEKGFPQGIGFRTTEMWTSLTAI